MGGHAEGGGRTRRNVLRGAAVAAVAGGAARPWSAAAGGAGREADGIAVGPGDPRYASLVDRHYNRRFQGAPDSVRLVASTRGAVRAVQDAVDAGQRVAVRSGGHCFEGFVDDPAVRTVIDVSPMDAVRYDARRRAFEVEAGVTLGELYRRLYLGWGVTLPAGSCPSVGVGGHVPGGAYGPLCRLYGLAVDHLYAVEAVVVGRDRRARAVVATREPDDPHRDLWWAHTGGGAGTFGLVTRYWFRSPGARGDDPSALLPSPPASALAFSATWRWDDLDEAAFTGLVRNYGAWAAAHSGPGAPEAAFYSEFLLTSRAAGTVTLQGQVTGDPGADRLLDAHLAALSPGVRARPQVRRRRRPWLTTALAGSEGDPGPLYRLKIKSAMHREPLDGAATAVAYRALSATGAGAPGGMLSLNTFGGQVNAVPPGRTAFPHRDSRLLLMYLSGWEDDADDAAHLAWIRGFYRDMHPRTGGVPAPAGEGGGCFLNYPDADLADPGRNPSGTPWQTLYFGAAHHPLHRAKRRWDPHNAFHHTLSVRP